MLKLSGSLIVDKVFINVNISCKTKVGIFSNTVRSVETMGIKGFPQPAHIMMVEMALRKPSWGEDQADN